jgi:HK97 family phage prohead protease
MATRTKSLAPFQIKATDDDARTFTGLVSTWDLDLGGDMIQRGAFKATLEKWRKSKRVMPLLDSHNAFGSVENVIGKLVDAKETQDGLDATFELLQDDQKAEAVYRRIKDGFVDGLSIGYRAVETREPDDTQRRKGVWRIIKELELTEVSVVLWPMNPDARIADVKAMLQATDPSSLTEEDRKELRALAGRIGTLIKASATPPDPAAAAEPKENAEQDPPKPEAPAVEADPQKGEPQAYEFAEALNTRLANLLRSAGASPT